MTVSMLRVSPLLATLLLLLLTLTPAAASAHTDIPFSLCAPSSTVEFVVSNVTISNFTLSPGTPTSFLLYGDLTAAVSDGAFNLRATIDDHQLQEIDIIQQFGTLKEILSNSLPIASGAGVTLEFAATIPTSAIAILTSDSDSGSGSATPTKQIQMQLDMYSQSMKRLACVAMTVEVDVPIPPVDEPSTSKVLGYCCALVSVFFFGTNFLFVKAYDTGDGVFFQWCLCIGIWLCGMVVQLIRGSPSFEPLAMVGGMMWCLGNCCTVTIIGLIGLGIGMVIWGGAGLVTGWAAGRFGWFGLNTQAVDDQAMNYIGLVLCIAGMGIMFLVKTVKEEQAAAAAAGDLTHHLLTDEPLSGSPSADGLLEAHMHSGAETISMRRKGAASKVTDADGHSPINGVASAPAAAAWTDSLSPATRRLLGISLSLFAGCLYGLNFSPPQYLIDTGRGASSHGIDYVFSHFTGIFVTSTAYMIGYSFYTKNHPWVSPQLVLPGMASGIGWGIAQINWFIANDQIHFVGTFPIVSCGPGLVATLCAIIFFGEIRGKRNYSLLALAAIVRKHKTPHNAREKRSTQTSNMRAGTHERCQTTHRYTICALLLGHLSRRAADCILATAGLLRRCAQSHYDTPDRPDRSVTWHVHVTSVGQQFCDRPFS